MARGTGPKSGSMQSGRVRPRTARARSSGCAPGKLQNAMKHFAVVADLHPAVALEIAHANAELFYDIQVGGEIGGMVRAA
jgi:hypothetical protein